MSQELQQYINNKTNKNKIRYLDISNNDLVGNADLKDFTALTSLNAYNNQLESIEFLNTLPNKEKLTSLNFFGNQISEAKNLQNLTSEQFNKLVVGMKDKSIQINSYKSTILMDLLEYTQHLIKSGDNSQRQQAQQLQAILQNSQVKSEQKPNNPKIPLLIGGGVVLVGLALGIGEILREELLIPRNISPQELATALKVPKEQIQ
ncbi:15868_t:CDS:2 [Funneliformis geosporum]|uniref:15868_t:CDS:1 n=1 Tax=Funneliformis geosporum TaxID=1117311 RepID=A0A9W4SF05_9GLOM|nr:15868_t:CDS:2 [Funneliformis geosporum]